MASMDAVGSCGHDDSFGVSLRSLDEEIQGNLYAVPMDNNSLVSPDENKTE